MLTWRRRCLQFESGHTNPLQPINFMLINIIIGIANRLNQSAKGNIIGSGNKRNRILHQTAVLL